jgi:hypothetical protein
MRRRARHCERSEAIQSCGDARLVVDDVLTRREALSSQVSRLAPALDCFAALAMTAGVLAVFG